MLTAVSGSPVGRFPGTIIKWRPTGDGRNRDFGHVRREPNLSFFPVVNSQKKTYWPATDLRPNVLSSDSDH